MAKDNVFEVKMPGGGSNPGNVIRFGGWAILAFVLVGLVSGVTFTIAPEEEGVVLRFGRFQRTVDPGLHFKMPPPFETLQKVPTQRQLKEEFGFRTSSAGVRTEYSEADFSDEERMLTGDLNVAMVQWITQYRVSEPYKYLFKVRNVRVTLRDMNEAVMREIVGDRSVTEVLTVGRQDIETSAQVLLQEMCDEYEMGIKIEQVVLQDVNPPDKVKPSFDEVNQAQQERERMINEAKTAFNKVIPAARGQAEQAVAQAEGYSVERVNRAKGEVARFTAVRMAYEAAPEVTRKRMYLETMAEVYPRVQSKIIISEEASGVLPLLDLKGVK